MNRRLEFNRKVKEKRAIYAGWLCEAIWEGKPCGAQLTAGRIEYHHETEAERGGDNSFDNCRAICIPCHRLFTKAFMQAKAKAERQRALQMNSKPKSAQPFPNRRKPEKPKREQLPMPPRRQMFVTIT